MNTGIGAAIVADTKDVEKREEESSSDREKDNG